MALQYSPKIVQDSLVMCLDASQNKSYPTDLPVKNGLNLWLDAADDATFSYSSGTSVSQWRDKSGNNFHASQATVLSQPSRSTFQNSRKTVNFDGTNDTVTISNFISNSEMSIFVVSNCGNTLFIEHSTDTNSNQGFYFYGGGNGMFAINRSPGVIYTSITNWLSGGYSVASAVNSTGLDLLTYKDGTQQTPTYDGRASRSNSYVTSTLYIGSRGANSLWSSGPIAEIIIYNRKVTDTERKQVHTYLGQKWGISNTDRSIVDLSNNNNNGLLGNGTVANMPDYDFYNKGTFSFTQTLNDTILTSLPITSTPALSNFTYEVWTKLNKFPTAVSPANAYGNTYRSGFLFGASYYQGAGLLWYGYPTGDAFSLYAFIRGNDAYRSTNGYPFALNQYYHCVMVNNYGANKLQLYINGTLYHEVDAATQEYNSSLASDAGNIGISKAQVDGGGTANYSHYDGIVAAARIYNKALSATEIAQNYEAQKSKFANTIVQQGLVLNLDVGNIYSYAGAGTTWYDVSGNTKDFIIDGSGITYNSGGYFTLADGGITRTATITNSTTCTVVVWIRTTDTQSLIFRGNNDNNYYLAAYNAGQGFYNSNCGTPTYWIDTISVANPNPTYLDGNWHMWEMKNVNFSSWTSFEFNKYGSYTFGNGAVGQIMIYDRNLSSGESLQIYNATKGRFGL